MILIGSFISLKEYSFHDIARHLQNIIRCPFTITVQFGGFVNSIMLADFDICDYLASANPKLVKN
jgi:hypothetical protein